MRTGQLYSFLILDERELKTGKLKAGLGENIISQCTFLHGLPFFHHIILFSSFLFSFFKAPDVSEVQLGAENFSSIWSNIKLWIGYSGGQKCFEPYFQSHSGAFAF